MSSPVDDDSLDDDALRRDAYRAAQKSTTNVYRFRRLKWGWPKLLGGSPPSGPRRRVLSITALLVLVVLAGVIGFIAISVWPAILSALS